jgi:hypothetical protein
MHGVDWVAMKSAYEPFLKPIWRRGTISTASFSDVL